MKEIKPITASEMGQKGYKARLKKLGGKKGYSQAMSEAVKKRWNLTKNRK